MAITQERLRELLNYDPETGVFTRKIRMANCAAGTVAGSLRDTGYISISIDDQAYRAHRLAWLYMTGEWPAQFLDHKNMIKSDNRWANLRQATKSENSANRSNLRTSKSGLKGAFYYKAYDRWTSQIWKDGKAHFLGYFDTKEEAHAAYCAAAVSLYGEFARA